MATEDHPAVAQFAIQWPRPLARLERSEAMAADAVGSFYEGERLLGGGTIVATDAAAIAVDVAA